MEKKSDLPPFKSCKSKPNIVANAFITFILGGFALGIISMLGFTLIWLFTPDREPLLFKMTIVLLTLILAGLIIYLLVYVWKSYGHTGIMIDETGITYYYRNKKQVVKQVPWTAILKKPDEKSGSSSYDVNELAPTYKGQTTMLQWWTLKDGKAGLESERFGAAGHSFHFIYLNRFTLISTFLLGLAHFRPDLRVNLGVFSAFYIHKDTYVFQKKKYIKDRLLVLVFIVVIALAVYWFTEP